MIDENMKAICKFAVDNSNRPLTAIEKEILKQAIDQSNNINELAAIILAAIQASGER